MSNEYYDWLYDCAQDAILDNEYLKKIEYCCCINSKLYLIMGIDKNWIKHIFKVHYNKECEWEISELIIE